MKAIVKKSDLSEEEFVLTMINNRVFLDGINLLDLLELEGYEDVTEVVLYVK